MTVRWLVEPKKGLCFWTSMQMLMRYHRLRLALPVPRYTAFDSWVDSGAAAPMMKRKIVQPLIEGQGLRWAYVSLKEQHLERLLSEYGPVMYICKLYPHSDIEHAVVITGIKPGPRERVVIFNDPGSGGEGQLPFTQLFQEHPPLFQAKEGGATKSAFVFYSRETPVPIRILPHKKAAISPIPRGTRYSDVYTRKTYEVNAFGRHMRTGSQQRLATQYGAGPTTQTFQARYNPLQEAVRKLQVGPAAMAYKPEPATQRWLQRLATQYGAGPTTQTFQARYNPLQEAVRKLQVGPAAMAYRPQLAPIRILPHKKAAVSPIPRGTTYSDAYTRKTYEVNAFGRHMRIGSQQGLATQYGARPITQTFQARYNPLQEAVRKLRG